VENSTYKIALRSVQFFGRILPIIFDYHFSELFAFLNFHQGNICIRTRDISGSVRLFLILTKNKFLTEILRAIDEKHFIIYKNQEYF